MKKMASSSRSHMLVPYFIYALFLVLIAASAVHSTCPVTVAIFGAPMCDGFTLACGREMPETDCYNLTLPSGTVSARLDCTNELTTWYNSSDCTGTILNANTPAGAAVNTTAEDCIKFGSFYLSLDYDAEAVCGSASYLDSTLMAFIHVIYSLVH